MIFYLLGILGYYKLRKQPVPLAICLAFIAVVTIPPGATLYLLLHKHWIFEALAFAGGIFCWTYIEYFLHRFLMHRRENRHYHQSHHFIHHKEPGTIYISWAKRILISLLTIVMIGFSISFSAYLWLPAGIMTGASLYTYMHYWLHQPWASRWLKPLQQFHIQHHCGDPETCYGVTSTWWDHLFGTGPNKNVVITEKKRAFYFRKDKKQETKIISLGNLIDEKISWDGKQSA